MPELIRHLWQLKTVVFLHWCLICVVLMWQIYFWLYFVVLLKSDLEVQQTHLWLIFSQASFFYNIDNWVQIFWTKTIWPKDILVDLTISVSAKCCRSNGFWPNVTEPAFLNRMLTLLDFVFEVREVVEWRFRRAT